MNKVSERVKVEMSIRRSWEKDLCKKYKISAKPSYSPFSVWYFRLKKLNLTDEMQHVDP